MENKKWTDDDLRTAFQDACKFINILDLQVFLLKRRELSDTSERQLTIPAVIKSLPEPDEIRMKARELDEKDFAQWMYEIQKGNVL